MIIVDDSLYYAARIKELADGNFFLGNPYFLEHSREKLVSFPLADWVAAIPTFFGFSITQVLDINVVLWTLITVILTYLLLKKMVSKVWLAFGVSMAIVFIFWPLLIRPVFMQIVFPVFLLFCLALLNFLRNGKPRDFLFLTLTVVLSFYTYPYLALVTGITLIICFKRQLLPIYFLAILIALPLIFYYLAVFASPFYKETMARIGLVSTHLPTLAALKYSLIVAVGVFVTKKRFFLYTGIAFILALLSNVITSRELETANHVGRFIDLWLVFAVTFLISKKNFLAAVILTLVLISNNFNKAYAVSLDHTSPLQFIDRYESKPVVIWTTKEISPYIPILTKHYVLFSSLGGLHLVSDQELAERYLLNNLANDLTLNQIKNDYREYAGVGKAIHQPAFHNYWVKICHCGKIVTAVQFRGEKYFQNLFDQYNEIIIDPKPYLQKYHVKYILWPKGIVPAFGKLIYDDGVYVIFKIGE